MKNYTLNLINTPLAKLKNTKFQNIKFKPFFEEIDSFLSDIKDFQTKNPEIQIITENNFNGVFGQNQTIIRSLNYSYEKEYSHIKIDNVFYKKDSLSSQIILLSDYSFGSLIKDLSNNDFYLIYGDYKNFIEIKYYKDLFFNDSINISQGEGFISISNGLKKGIKENSIYFDEKSIFKMIRKNIDYQNDSYYIKFNENNSQLDEATLLNGNFIRLFPNPDTWFSYSEKLQDKFRGKENFTLNEIIEISEELKVVYELNILKEDFNNWNFVEIEDIISTIHKTIKDNKNNLYLLPKNILSLINSINEDIQIPNINNNENYDIKHNSLLEFLGIDFYKNNYDSLNISNIKTIFHSLKEDLDNDNKSIVKNKKKI